MFRSLEASAALVLGTSETLLAKVLSAKGGIDAVGLAHEYLTLILRGVAVPPLDAELLASQATIQVIGPEERHRALQK